MDTNFADAIDRIADLAQKAAALDAVRQVFELPTGQKLILRNDGSSETIGEVTSDHYGLMKDAPARINRKVLIQTTDSLVEYIARFKGKGTTLFADIARNRIVASLDYHISGTETDHHNHFAVLDLPYSEEWNLWAGIHGKLMPQLEFTRFVEENAADIKAPSGADLIECCRDLQAKRNVNFTKAVRTSSDNESFEFTDDTNISAKKDGHPVEVPTKFLLSFPVYFGSRYVELAAFLRWKLDEGQLYLGISRNRAEQVRQAMFKEIVTELSERSGAPVVYGNGFTSVSL